MLFFSCYKKWGRGGPVLKILPFLLLLGRAEFALDQDDQDYLVEGLGRHDGNYLLVEDFQNTPKSTSTVIQNGEQASSAIPDPHAAEEVIEIHYLDSPQRPISPPEDPSVDEETIQRVIQLTAELAERQKKLAELLLRTQILREKVASMKARAAEAEKQKEKATDVLDRIEFLETITKHRIPATCHELFRRGIKKSGKYLIDPDGPHGNHGPMEVFCDMEDGQGTTWIHKADSQDPEGPQPDCNGNGCYSKPVFYLAPDDQISALTDYSDTCHQDLTVEILNNKTDHELKREKRWSIGGWWLDGAGRKRDIWSSSSQQDHSCEYNIVTENALNHSICTSGTGFDCDCIREWDPRYAAHKAKLTSKLAQLPVNKLFLEAPGLIGMEQVEVKHHVGPLVCRGKRSVRAGKTSGSADFKSCGELYSAGVRHNGYHWIRDEDVYRLVYCDMSGGPAARERSRLFLGPSRAASGPVHFHLARTRSFNGIQQVVDFDHKVTDLNTSWNTTYPRGASFIVPVPGYYHFHLQYLSAGVYNRRGAEIYLNLNQHSVNGAVTAVYPNSLGVTSAILRLKKGDEVYCRLFYGGAFSHPRDMHTYFTGSLLRPM